MTVERSSPCKVNLLLNILGRRPDGYHELETVMYPIVLCDRLTFARQAHGIELVCSDPRLPADGTNLVFRAAEAFFHATQVSEGVRIDLEKRIPLAAGLGGGSGNAATTLLGLNTLFDRPLSDARLAELAADLGTDVPFFLQSQPALATGRGEQVQPLEFFRALCGLYVLLIHPGFGVPTAWAYQQLAHFPEALHGRVGRAERLISLLRAGEFSQARAHFYNALEAPVLCKYPVLALSQEFLRDNGALATLMSGSGSATLALFPNPMVAESVGEKFKTRFGDCWTAIVPL